MGFEDKTIVQLELGSGKFEVKTLYRLVRGIEARGFADLVMSWATLKRPAARAPGQPDTIEVTMTSAQDFVLTGEGNREHSSKTVFGAKLTRSTFPTAALVLAQRFRWVETGKCLKPSKQYVTAAKRITLKPSRPKLV